MERTSGLQHRWITHSTLGSACCSVCCRDVRSFGPVPAADTECSVPHNRRHARTRVQSATVPGLTRTCTPADAVQPRLPWTNTYVHTCVVVAVLVRCSFTLVACTLSLSLSCAVTGILHISHATRIHALPLPVIITRSKNLLLCPLLPFLPYIAVSDFLIEKGHPAAASLLLTHIPDLVDKAGVSQPLNDSIRLGAGAFNNLTKHRRLKLLPSNASSSNESKFTYLSGMSPSFTELIEAAPLNKACPQPMSLRQYLGIKDHTEQTYRQVTLSTSCSVYRVAGLIAISYHVLEITDNCLL
jgi:hypothetical protein